MIIADNHCHIIKEYFDDPVKEIKRLKSLNLLDFICSMGLDFNTNEENLNYKRIINDNFFKIGLGLHPSEVIELGKKSREEAKKILQQIKNNIEIIDFVGEIGIDFTYPNARVLEEEQLFVFKEFCRFAKENDKPVSIHCREAWPEIMKIIEEVYKVDEKSKSQKFYGFLHSFTGDFGNGRFFVDRGFKLGLNGIITFKKSEELRITILQLLDFYKYTKSFDEIFALETDTPYLTPEPNRRNKNNPENIIFISQYLLDMGIS